MNKSYVLWGIIIALIFTNITTIITLFQRKGVSPKVEENLRPDIIARVGNEAITREEWLNKMEYRYGKNVLIDEINALVVIELAKKNNVTVSDAEIERELSLIQTSGQENTEVDISVDELKREIRIHLLFAKYLTKDVVIHEKDLKEFYDKNKSLYDIPNLFYISHIVLEKEEKAKEVYKNLLQGSNFSTLAREVSTDAATVNSGGEMGYIDVNAPNIPKAYKDSLNQMKVGTFSPIIKLDSGYAILYLQDIKEGKEYRYNEVKEEIKRTLALQQINRDIPIENFWSEFQVKTEIPMEE